VEATVALTIAIREASSRGERAALLATYAREQQCSLQTARRHAGLVTRPRCAPTWPLPTAQLDQVVALWRATSTEKYRVPTGLFRDAIRHGERNGLIPEGALSVGQLRRYLTHVGASRAQLARPTPHVTLRTEAPNQAHVWDSSRCRQWYLDDGGRIRLQRYSDGTAEYNNKDLRGRPVYRFLLADHATGHLFVQYYNDETVPTVLTFLYAAWAPKRMRHTVGPTGVERWWPAPFDPDGYEAWAALPELRDYYFRGAPRLLLLDRHASNQAQATREVCRRLGVDVALAQTARAKGAGETYQWIWERRFESWLAAQPAPDLATLNTWALDFLIAYTRDERHTRHGMTRAQAWALIEPAQLREVTAPWPLYQEIARKAPEPRRVHAGDAHGGLLHHQGRKYRLPAVDLVHQEVEVSYSVFHHPKLEARAADGRIFLLEPIAMNRFGQPLDAPELGERYARAADTVTQRTEKRLEAVQAALPPLEYFGREGDRRGRPRLLPPRRGVEIAITTSMGAREIDRKQLNSRVIAARNGVGWDDEMAAWRAAYFTGRDTVPEAVVDEIVARAAARDAVPSPKVVNLFPR
jgi:hypothetical protein